MAKKKTEESALELAVKGSKSFLQALKKKVPISFWIYFEGVGGSPQLHEPTSAAQYKEALETLGKVYDSDANINSKYGGLERYAISLMKAKEYKEAKRIFDVITAKKNKFFNPLGRKMDDNDYTFDAVVDKPGHLGYEGVFQYARAELELGNSEKAKKLLQLFAAVPAKCYPIRIEDIRVEALTLLVEKFHMPYKHELKAAKDNQY